MSPATDVAKYSFSLQPPASRHRNEYSSGKDRLPLVRCHGLWLLLPRLLVLQGLTQCHIYLLAPDHIYHKLASSLFTFILNPTCRLVTSHPMLCNTYTGKVHCRWIKPFGVYSRTVSFWTRLLRCQPGRWHSSSGHTLRHVVRR